jgi:predicted RNA-binding Zn-ribbon protein involved in translation (DUF1610 family)
MSTAWRVWIRCPVCRTTTEEDGVATLRRAGMIRRAGQVDQAMLVELLNAVGQRLVCAACGQVGQQWGEWPDEEAWPADSTCQSCGQPIPAARLAALPSTRLCASCQVQEERGAVDGDSQEFCPKCGAVLRLVTAQGPVTRYQWRCTTCGLVEMRR